MNMEQNKAHQLINQIKQILKVTEKRFVTYYEMTVSLTTDFPKVITEARNNGMSSKC